MKYIYLVIALYCAEWIFYPEAEWKFLLLNKYLIISFLFTAIFVEFKTNLLNRSILALLTLSVWCDFITFALRHYNAIEIDLSVLCSLIFFVWLYFTVKRSYPDHIDTINSDMACILVKRPTSPPEVIKSLVGFPAASVCVLAGGYVWSFRKHSGKFEKSLLCNYCLEKHLIINTWKPVTPELISELENLIGEKRFPYCKCVWTIRNVLNLIGGKYRIISWLDYFPSFYVLRILRG